MSLVCAQCSRVNPPEAAYCYYDGAALAGRAGGPIHAGSAPFPNQFVFPNGLACRNFDQLALTCQQQWPAAVDLLKQGYLGSFFGGMGRVDLAMAAQEAAQFPDIERGLDMLLAKLPTQALQAPKLQAEPTNIHLGVCRLGTNRTTEIQLSNQGMRLLFGTATSDCKWLTFGEAPGHAEKLFQFGGETQLTVQVRGQHLRAGTKPIEGQVTLDSNGGTVTVTIKADVPITPYADGAFAGATTPRQVAEKAKANPKDTATYFESGAIAKWYAANGWNYPVQGPTMPGLGAIQQFFEALGVAKAPKIDIHPPLLELQGAVGKTVETAIEVTTAERKVVYGWATCDQSWVEVGKTRLTGKTAIIPLRLRIPSPCPPTLQATIQVVGNGNQKRAIPLQVKVAGGRHGVELAAPVEHDVLEIVEDNAPLVVAVLDAPSATSKPPSASYAPLPPSSPFAVTAEPPPLPPTNDGSPFALPDASSAGSVGSSVAKPPQRLPLMVRLALHTIPIGLLGFILLILLAVDVLHPPGAQAVVGDSEIDPHPLVKLVFDEGRADENYRDTMTFGVQRLFPDDPAKGSVKLNWYENGAGNSVVARIDTKEHIFGVDGLWPKEGGTPKNAGKYGGRSRTFEFKDGIYVTQTVTIEPGDLVQKSPGEYKRLLNMCLARYKIHNKDTKAHQVGLRILMDTCIGDNDGVPFLLPNVKEMVSTSKEFKGVEVPDFVQVLERPNLDDPGIILQLNLRVTDKLERPSRFLLTHYPGKEGAKFEKWDVPIAPIAKGPKDKGDSCVVMWWDEKLLKAGETREVGFTYGVNSLSIASNKLAVSVGGAMHKGGELTVVALVADANAKTVTLELPKNLELIEPKTLTQPVNPPRDGRPSPVTWRVRAISAGSHDVTVSTDTNLKQSRRVRIALNLLFN